MKKHFVFYGVVMVICLFYHLQVFAENQSFEPDECRYGEAGSWAGACACYRSYGLSGRYCDEKALKSCDQNQDCPSGSYCLSYDSLILQPALNELGQGACFLTKASQKISIENRDFYVSQSLMNKKSADRFCEALSDEVKTSLVSATRQDLKCDSSQVGCIDENYLSAISQQVGSRGFLWLDYDKPQTAYYIDLNDGNLYNMDASSGVVCQALCVTRNDKNEK